MSLAAGASALTGIFLTTTPKPMVWMLLVIALLSLLLGMRAHGLYARTRP
jgi:hypothetical protein